MTGEKQAGKYEGLVSWGPRQLLGIRPNSLEIIFWKGAPRILFYVIGRDGIVGFLKGRNKWPDKLLIMSNWSFPTSFLRACYL